MNESPMQEIFAELFQTMEAAEAQSAALLSFLKAKKVVKEKELAPYLEQASTAASVRWTAARARMNRLLEAAMKPAEEEKKQDAGEGNAEISPKKNSGASENQGAQKKSQPQAKSQKKDAASPNGEASVAALRNPAAGREEGAEPEEADAKPGTEEARKQPESQSNSQGKDSGARDSSANRDSAAQPDSGGSQGPSGKPDSGTKLDSEESDSLSTQRRARKPA